MWKSVENHHTVFVEIISTFVSEMSVESKIKVKTLALYIVVAAAAAAMFLYFYRVRMNIDIQKGEVERQNQILTLTNELIYTVAQAQSSANLYVSTKNRRYSRGFNSAIARVDSLVDTLLLMRPVDIDNLRQINELLEQQSKNLIKLDSQFSRENPMAAISEKLSTFEAPRQQDSIFVTSSRLDTIVNKPPKRTLFQRIGDIFKANRDSTIVVVNEKIDTVTRSKKDSIGIIGQVDSIVREAGQTYRQNIAAIQRQVGKLIANDAQIAARISRLLLELHRNTLDATLAAIEESEREIDRNFTLSLIGGVVALVVILFFVVMILTDINRGQRARRELEAAHARAGKLMESRHRLLLSISHDIKSPLSSIVGYLDMEEEGKWRAPMRNSARHIEALLENLLEFSSLEQGTLQLSESEFSLDSLTQEVAEMFLPLAMSKMLAFNYDCQRVRVVSDKMKVKQIVVNLVSNAVKYTPKGEVYFSICYRENNIAIVVRDSGVGIAAHRIKELYKPFVRVDSSSVLAEGSGLGMFVVKGLVDTFGGNIAVESQVGVGTKMVVTIAAKAVEESVERATKRIVIFEDDPAIEAAAAGMLRKLGHLVVEQDYQFILTDLDMGEVTGYDVLESAEGRVVVAMSGRGDYTSGQAAKDGFAAFIAKPFNIDDLRAVFGEGEHATEFDDGQADVARLFAQSTRENIEQLHRALSMKDFDLAQALCHKMLPMWIQFGYRTTELRRMDAARSREYDCWQEDVKKILEFARSTHNFIPY